MFVLLLCVFLVIDFSLSSSDCSGQIAGGLSNNFLKNHYPATDSDNCKNCSGICFKKCCAAECHVQEPRCVRDCDTVFPDLVFDDDEGRFVQNVSDFKIDFGFIHCNAYDLHPREYRSYAFYYIQRDGRMCMKNLDVFMDTWEYCLDEDNGTSAGFACFVKEIGSGKPQNATNKALISFLSLAGADDIVTIPIPFKKIGR